ncbi:PRC-barrel domain containing protein (plasmid) [Halolamina sp. CBA1230]|uniref:hypothetical protein n=1 Tax=Halolamina sp. CBA1230 TaxID=1853690 RepID=UPI0009A163A8|nr:hypothetical protein [Halolamina sp. CBA1230]QKY22000.1 PRC-barrel domain containing protein [Halolamina sp. CBA1230]
MTPRSATEFTPEDEGKRVVTTSGDVVGEVVRCEDGTAFVRPRRELVVGYGSRLTGCWDPSELFPLDGSAVVADAEGRIQIKPEERAESGPVARPK